MSLVPRNALTVTLVPSKARCSTLTCFENTRTKRSIPAFALACNPDPGLAHVSVRPSVVTKAAACVSSIIPFKAIVSLGRAEAIAERSDGSSETATVACAGHAAGPAAANDGRAAVGATLGSWQATTTARRSKGVMLNARFMRVLSSVTVLVPLRGDRSKARPEVHSIRVAFEYAGVGGARKERAHARTPAKRPSTLDCLEAGETRLSGRAGRWGHGIRRVLVRAQEGQLRARRRNSRRRALESLSYREAPVGIEPTNRGFAD